MEIEIIIDSIKFRARMQKVGKHPAGNPPSSVRDELIFKFHTPREIATTFSLVLFYMQSPTNWMAHAWLLSKSQTALSKGKAGEKRRFEKSPLKTRWP